MKKTVIAAAAIIILTACNNSDTQVAHNDSTAVNGAETDSKPVDASQAAQIKFEQETYDFGLITQGEKVTYDFKFRNTGKTPLIITDAQASCGCTVPEKPEKPINPGEEGVIKVVFNSAGKIGMQNKMVTITSNAIPAISELHLIGDIKEAKNN